MSFLESRSRSAPDGIGKPVRRREDDRLLRGRGQYGNDYALPGQAYAYVLRSPHAHARIVSIDTTRAVAYSGVIAVLTGKDAAADGLRPLPHKPVPNNPHEVPLRSRTGAEFFLAPHPLLATDFVRYVGEPVAVVVATSVAVAMDAADLVEVEYESLPAVTNARDAMKPDASLVWPQCGSNVCVDSHTGDEAAVRAAFEKAAHVIKLDTHVHRVTGVPIEPRNALGDYDKHNGRYVLYTSAGGGVARQRADVAGALNVPEDRVRIISADVGGNFGTRNSSYPEYALMPWAARRVGRPIKWTSDRREAFLTDYHGRDLVSQAELALDRDGRILALRAVNMSNAGAATVSFVPLAKGIAVSTALYHVPIAYMRGLSVLTHTSPTTAYRSAGRPEVVFVIERMLDIAARRHGFDRIELRRRNLVPPTAMPYRNALGLVFDTGDYPAALEHALRASEWSGFEARRAEARSRGRYRGIGIATSVELNTGAPRERADVTVNPKGRIEVVLGTMSAGQGHETTFAQMVAEWFGVSVDAVDLVTGDSDRVKVGGGSGSARSMRLGGTVIAKASDQIVEKGKRIAAAMLEAAEVDIEFAERQFRVKGTDRGVDLFAVAAAGPLAGMADETMPVPSYAYSVAVCEVEIDPDTGQVEVVSYTSIDDCGRAVNPLLIHGQTHGGIAQGIGQALWEHCRYEPESGQMLTATFMDYSMPRADRLPSFRSEITEIASTTNPLGMRGGSEGGITPALGAIGNAIVDALTEFGIEHVELPATADQIWKLIQHAPGRT